MSWARLDDNRHDHEKILGLGDGLEALAAVGLLDHGLTWANRHRRKSKTPGLIPWGFLRQRAGKHCAKLVGMLLANGLVDADPEDRGVFIHDFSDYGPKRDPDEASAAGKRGADSRWGNRGSPDSNSHDSSHADSQSNSHSVSHRLAVAKDASRVGALASAPASPSRPVPSSGSVGRSSPVPGRAGEERDLGEATIKACRRLKPRWTDKGLQRAYADAVGRANSGHRASIALLRVAAAADSTAPRRVLTDGWWWDDTDTRSADADATVASQLEESA